MYKGKKKIAVCVLAGLMCLLTAFVAGCKKTPAPEPPAEPDNPPAETVAPTLNETAVELYLGEEFTLTVANTEETVEWQVENESVAECDNGNVKAVGLGKTTVRAYVGDYTLTCAVSVSIKYVSAPKLVLKNEVLFEGSYSFNVEVNYEYFLHPALQVGDDEAEVTFSLSTESDIITVNNDKISFTATAPTSGEEEVTLSCEYESKTYSVTFYVSSSEVSA